MSRLAVSYLTSFQKIFNHLCCFGPCGFSCGVQDAAALAIENSLAGGPEQGLLRPTAHLVCIGKIQLTAGSGAAGITPEHDRQLFAGDVVIAI